MAPPPPLAPLPPPEVQRSIPSGEWELYLDAWILLLEARLRPSQSSFNDESAVLFLSSFYHQTAGGNAFHAGAKARKLRKLCFLLTRRIILEASETPSELLGWKYLGEMSCCYPSSSALKKLLAEAWDKHEAVISSGLEKGKAAVIVQLSVTDSSSTLKAVADIRLLTILASSLPACGHVLMAGSDYLDTLAEAYQGQRLEDVRKSLVANIYVGLTSLLKGARPNLTLLLDQLFGLKATAGVGTSKQKKEPTLLSDVICSSDILSRLERYMTVQPQKRGQDLVSSLRTYQNESRSFHHRYQKPKKRLDKGKERVSDLSIPEEIHAHRMSLITQIQDLFPDLGSGYIVRLLDHYGDNPETIIAHLLDESIPPELQNLNKSEQLPPIPTPQQDPLPPKSTPTPTPAPSIPTEPRRNIFDKDVDLAELARSDQTDQDNLRFGRANQSLTADDILADRSNHTANKAAILSALATFDSDDDERDDTYDATDVGGTVDANANDEASTDDLDMTLLRAYKSNAALFARDSATRRSQPRDVLKRESGLTDEAIEGWAVMLNRNPSRLAKLEAKLAVSAGGSLGPGGLVQPEIQSTSYRRPKGDEGDESGTEAEASGRGGFGRGRGAPRGRGRGRGGGGPSTSSQSQNPAVARQRKEENKSSRANHNRRQQRAKKVGRAGGLVG